MIKYFSEFCINLYRWLRPSNSKGLAHCALHCTGYDICHILFRQDQQKKFLEFLVVTFDQNKVSKYYLFQILLGHNIKSYISILCQLPPAAAVVATVWIRMWRGIDLWSWLTFIMVLPMLAVIKRYFLMMSANFRQPPTKCLVANTLYIYLHIYQEFKSHF